MDTDEIIARRLAESNYLNNKTERGKVSKDASGRVKVEVWCRSRVENAWALIKEYQISRDTFYDWTSQVQAAVDEAKGITAPTTRRRNPFKRTLAQGHKTRESDDPTPQKKCPDAVSSWNEARMKLVGAIDRYSRKRR